MKMYEINYRKLEESGMLGEKTYPFETNQESEWDNLEELGEYIFEGEVKVEGNWATFDGSEYKFNWKD